LNIIIVHHHLYTGGVTKVIKTQIEALSQNSEHKIHLLCGDIFDFKCKNVIFHHLPEINYFKASDTHINIDQHKNIISTGLNDLCLKIENPIFHIHNLNLGKNPLLNIAMFELIERGIPVFNHCHDFAEDNRPANMEWLSSVIEGTYKLNLEEVLYPNNQNVLYGVINDEDKKLLSKHKSTYEKVVFLPNAISPPPILKPDPDKIREQLGIKNDLPIIVYPVRVIQRKNIAELILLTALFKDKANWCVTQAPKNPDELVQYNSWKVFCQKHRVPLIFEAGVSCDFHELMWSAERIITTSYKEGFGLTFLEPWLYDKAVIGRNLPSITKDFKSQNINLNLLYGSIDINGNDFINLSESEKEKEILNIIQSKEKSEKFIHKNSLNKLNEPILKSLIDNNKKAIQSSYSVHAYGEKLNNIYDRLTKSN